MKHFCVKILIPVVPTENAAKLGEEINKAVENIAKDSPFVKIELHEYNPEIFDEN